MVIDWTCVYDDGVRPFSVDLAGDQRRPLSLVQNEDVTIRIELVNPAGEPVDLGADETTNYLELTLRLAENRKLTKKATRQAAGRYLLAIAAADTKSLARQHAAFDLFAIKGSARAAVVPTSELSLGR